MSFYFCTKCQIVVRNILQSEMKYGNTQRFLPLTVRNKQLTGMHWIIIYDGRIQPSLYPTFLHARRC